MESRGLACAGMKRILEVPYSLMKGTGSWGSGVEIHKSAGYDLFDLSPIRPIYAGSLVGAIHSDRIPMELLISTITELEAARSGAGERGEKRLNGNQGVCNGHIFKPASWLN